MPAGDPGLWLPEGAQKASQLPAKWFGWRFGLLKIPVAHKNQRFKSKIQTANLTKLPERKQVVRRFSVNTAVAGLWGSRK